MSKLKAKKYDQGKPPLSMVSRESIEGEAEALAYGAKKYSRNNYKAGIAWSRLLDSALRHTYAFSSGEDIDPESKVNHIKCAKANLGMLLYLIENELGEDDR